MHLKKERDHHEEIIVELERDEDEGDEREDRRQQMGDGVADRELMEDGELEVGNWQLGILLRWVFILNS